MSIFFTNAPIALTFSPLSFIIIMVMKILLCNIEKCELSQIPLDKLSERTKNKVEALQNTNPRRAVQSAISDLMIRSELLSRGVLPCDFLENENGKPFFDGLDLCFSIAHSKKIVAVAFDDAPVGIDVQMLAPMDKKLVEKILNEGELENYNTLEMQEQKIKYFYRCFTEKEAYVKLLGETLPYPPSLIKNYLGAKFVTKYLFQDNEVYCLTVSSKNLNSISFSVLSPKQLITN